MIVRFILPTILILGIVIGVFLVTNRQNLFSWAASEDVEIQFPQDVIITNVTTNTLVISYFTPVRKIHTKISYGKDSRNLSYYKMDDRDMSAEGEERFAHYVTLNGLEPNTDYYIKIERYGQKLKNSFLVQKTAPVPASALPVKKFTGSVERTDRFGYIDTLIYFKTETGQLLSTLPDPVNGTWTFDVSQYRSRDLQTFYEVLPIDMVDLLAVVGNDGIAFLKIYAYGLDKPRLLRLNLVKVPFYGIELGSSQYEDEEATLSGEESEPQEEEGIIARIWLFITSWFRFS